MGIKTINYGYCKYIASKHVYITVINLNDSSVCNGYAHFISQ